MFTGFKPQGLQKIANRIGYTGSMQGFDSYLQQNPDKQNMMNMYNQRAMQMAQGGMVKKMAVGGFFDGQGNSYSGVTDKYNQQGQLGFTQQYDSDPDSGAKSTRTVYADPNQQFYKDDPTAPADTSGYRAYNLKDLGYNVPQYKPPATTEQFPIAGDIEKKTLAIATGGGQTRALGEDNQGNIPENFGSIKTLAAGEDDPNMGNFEGRLPGPETDPFFNIKSAMVGEDDGDMGNRPIVNQPIATRAYGEDGSGGMPIQETTMAVGEEDGSGGGGLKTLAFGEEDGVIRPDPRPMTRAIGEDGITSVMGEDGNTGLSIDPRQPKPKQTQAYVPTLGEGLGQVPAYGSSDTTPPVDPYADYRQNVARFPETGTFKNPKIQTSFDAMSKELETKLAPTPKPENLKKRSDIIIDYVKNIYSGPLYRSDGKTFTEEFKQYANDSGITINGSFLNVQEGSPITETAGYLPAPPRGNVTPGIGDVSTTLAQTGAIPVGAVTQPELIQREDGQFIDPRTGQIATAPTATTTVAGTQIADPAQEVATTQMNAAQATPAVQTALQANQAAQTDPNDPRSKVTAAQQTASSVGNLNAAQGNATLMENPVQREIQNGELISGVADAEKASKFTEQIEAATATPSEKATVQGQLATLTENFDANNPPAWAAGTLRAVQAQMAQRGLGASSMAGQAMIQGALESALPIAQADAQVNAQFEGQNLSNRQARAMLAAQQRATFLGQEFDQAFQSRVQNSARIGDIANMNFTAEQNIAMENSRAVNTMNLQNLSNKQGMVMAEASALANLDMSNLSNNQQAAVQNAQNFLQTEMANLSNEQQTALFNAQAINQSLLTDQAATNAARQFNATSDNQTKQFMSNLANQVSQFNASQVNAQNQFNAGELNTLSRFNAEVANQRDQFNATNQLAIAQNNAVWRREIATADTAAINRANELNAKAVLDVSNTQYDNLWSFYADTMEWAWKSSESEFDRIRDMTVANISADAQREASARAASSSRGSAVGSLIASLGSAAISGYFGCWVAREVYGTEDLKWLDFREWLLNKAPSWLRWLYQKYGESFANFIKDKPFIKNRIRKLMDRVICL